MVVPIFTLSIRTKKFKPPFTYTFISYLFLHQKIHIFMYVKPPSLHYYHPFQDLWPNYFISLLSILPASTPKPLSSFLIQKPERSPYRSWNSHVNLSVASQGFTINSKLFPLEVFNGLTLAQLPSLTSCLSPFLLAPLEPHGLFQIQASGFMAASALALASADSAHAQNLFRTPFLTSLRSLHKCHL